MSSEVKPSSSNILKEPVTPCSVSLLHITVSPSTISHSLGNMQSGSNTFSHALLFSHTFFLVTYQLLLITQQVKPMLPCRNLKKTHAFSLVEILRWCYVICLLYLLQLPKDLGFHCLVTSSI